MLESRNADFEIDYSLVFAEKLGNDNRIRTWCIKHLRGFAQHLEDLPEWHNLLPLLDKDFQERWDKFVTVTYSSLPTRDNKLPQDFGNDEETIPRAVKESEKDNDENMVSGEEEWIRNVVEGSKRDIDDVIIQKVVKESKRPGFNMHHRFKDPVSHQHKNSDTDWENRKSSLIGAYIEPENKEEYKPTPTTPQRSYSRRAKFGMRPSPLTIKDKSKGQQIEHDTTWADEYTESTSPDMAKAVHILGMNDISSNIVNHSRRNRVDRVICKLAHIG